MNKKQFKKSVKKYAKEMNYELKPLTEEELEKSKPFLEIQSRLQKFQEDVVNDYFSTPEVIRLNYLEHIRLKCQEISSKEEFEELLKKEKEMMKSKKEPFTHIERIEYRTLNKLYREVIDCQGGLSTNNEEQISINIDGQQVKLDKIKFKN